MLIFEKINYSILDQLQNILIKENNFSKLGYKKFNINVNKLKLKINNKNNNNKLILSNINPLSNLSSLSVFNGLCIEKNEVEKEIKIKEIKITSNKILKDDYDDLSVCKEKKKHIDKLEKKEVIKNYKKKEFKFNNYLDKVMIKYYLNNRKWYCKHIKKYMKDNGKMIIPPRPFNSYKVILDYELMLIKLELLEKYINYFF